MKQITRHILLPISITVLSAGATLAQSSPAAPKASATVAGRITLDGAGIPGLQVMLKPHINDGVTRISFAAEQPPALSATTDAEGRYRLTDVAPGSYRVSAFAPAYAVEGETNPFTPGKTVHVAEGENVENVDFSLARGAVITGKVSDEKDRPVIAAAVSAYKLDPEGKRRRIGFPNFVRWETDDRGVYRIFGLEPGRYLVAAGISSDDRLMSPGGTGAVGFRRTFHPDAPEEEQARIVEAKSGEEAANIDIKVAPTVKGYAVTGRVVEADTDKPVPGVTVNCNAIKGSTSFRTGGPVTNALGEFRFENLPPGSYRAFVLTTNAQGPPTIGEEITFDVAADDVRGVEIRVRRGATISGVVAVEGSNDTALRAKLAQVNLITPGRAGILVRQGGNGTIGPNGTFKLSDVKPGNARIMMAPIGPNGFALLRVEHNGVEVKEFNVNAGDHISGVRLVFSYGAAVIAGRVEVKGGALPLGARLSVTAWPQDVVVAGRPFNSVDVDGRGQFVIEGLAQGTYKLVLTSATPGFPEDSPVKWLRMEQMITIAGEGRHEVTLVVDLTRKEPKEEDK